MKNKSFFLFLILGFTLILGIAVSQTQKSPLPKCVQKGDIGVEGDTRKHFGNHFKNWLAQNGYPDLAKSEGWGGFQTETGVESCNSKTNREPVIFIHGNNVLASYWEPSRKAFLKDGYTPGELYAIGWGEPKAPGKNLMNYHSFDYINKIRKFILAVKAYTGAQKVDVIGHSMGVTLSLKAILGGVAYNNPGSTDDPEKIGEPINQFIDTFVGIGGGLRGIHSCETSCADAFYAMNSVCKTNGFMIGGDFSTELIKQLQKTKPANYVYSIRSTEDELVCTTDYEENLATPKGKNNCFVDGFHTSSIPRENGSKVYKKGELDPLDPVWVKFFMGNHFTLKDKSVQIQINMVKNHKI